MRSSAGSVATAASDAQFVRAARCLRSGLFGSATGFCENAPPSVAVALRPVGNVCRRWLRLRTPRSGPTTRHETPPPNARLPKCHLHQVVEALACQRRTASTGSDRPQGLTVQTKTERAPIPGHAQRRGLRLYVPKRLRRQRQNEEACPAWVYRLHLRPRPPRRSPHAVVGTANVRKAVPSRTSRLPLSRNDPSAASITESSRLRYSVTAVEKRASARSPPPVMESGPKAALRLPPPSAAPRIQTKFTSHHARTDANPRCKRETTDRHWQLGVDQQVRRQA